MEGTEGFIPSHKMALETPWPDKKVAKTTMTQCSYLGPDQLPQEGFEYVGKTECLSHGCEI
jgi:hypothetical protein